jgi:ribosomal protein L25 (general stress protein Ctc)
MIFTYEVQIDGNFEAVEGAGLWIGNLSTTLKGTNASPAVVLHDGQPEIIVRVHHADYAKVVREPGWDTKFSLKHNDKGGTLVAKIYVDPFNLNVNIANTY